MKKIHSALALLALAGITAAALFTSTPQTARADDTVINPTTIISMTNLFNKSFAGGSSNTLTGSIITLRKDRGMAWLPSWFMTNAGDPSLQITFHWLFSADAVNWSSSFVGNDKVWNLASTNFYRGYYVFSGVSYTGVRYARIGSVEIPGTNRVFFSNSIVSLFN